MTSFAKLFPLLVGLGLLPMSARAQIYPDKPITIVHGFDAGGGADLFLRVVAPEVSKLIGQQIVISYRTGAGGDIAIDYVSRAAPDGYTLLLATPGVVTNPFIHAGAHFDVLHDFAPVSLIGTVSNVLVTSPDFKVNSVAELIAKAKAEPGVLNYASSGVGTSLHLDGELFKYDTGIDIVHVPYKGGMQAQQDVVAGQDQLMFNVLPSALPMIKAGMLRALAVTGPSRDATLPDVPTMMEAGVANYTAVTWNGILAPAGTPRPIIDKLNAAFTQALKDRAMTAKLSAMGQGGSWSSPEEFAKFLHDEQVKWATVIKAAGIEPR
jgi:tripartite-type tricarboxylate transporter receptor subunit TctC